MDIMKMINQAKDIIIKPKDTIEKLKNETVTMKDIIIYLIILTLLLIYSGNKKQYTRNKNSKHYWKIGIK